MIPKIFPILAAAPAVTNHFGTNPTRIFPYGQATQATAKPYATYGVFNGNPENMMDKIPEIDNMGTQIDVWAITAESCKDAATAIRNTLEPLNHMTSFQSAEKDVETQLYRCRLEFDVWQGR